MNAAADAKAEQERQDNDVGKIERCVENHRITAQQHGGERDRGDDQQHVDRAAQEDNQDQGDQSKCR